MESILTHPEWIGTYDGYMVMVRHCAVCNVYLGVNYPSDYCSNHNRIYSVDTLTDYTDSNQF
jgi:hypothetical protein